MTRRILPALLVASLARSGALAAPATSIPPANQPLAGPVTAIERLADAYRDRSVDGIGSALSADYTFHAVGSGTRDFVLGSAREFEMQAVRGMLEGVRHGDQVLMPPARSVSVVADGVSEAPDPEHADSTEHYRLLTVRRFEIHVRLENGSTFDTPGLVHVFHVVRGDAAELVPGQTADAGRWYVRRWIEDLSGFAEWLAQHPGPCGEPPPPSAVDLAGGGVSALGIHALENPACRALAVRCDLPGTEPAHVEVYDASGRLVNRRDLRTPAAGTVTVEAGSGAQLAPGVYWVRLRQGKLRPAARMVVVAK